MSFIEERESQRLKLQDQLDGVRSAENRNRMGQFATPTALAREILAHALKLLPEDQPIRFLDPAIGTGSFYSALLSIVHNRQVGSASCTKSARGDESACGFDSAYGFESACGYEIDQHYGKPAQKLWKDTNLDIRIEDFTEAEPSGQGATLVIANPPYIRHHHIDPARKCDIQQRTEQACGIKMGGLSGLYCYFMGLCHPFMDDGAIAGWLIPSEFMSVNYGRALQRYLLERVTLLQIHRYDPLDVQFDDALVSSAVVWFRKAVPPADHTVRFTYGGTLARPLVTREVPASELAAEPKWIRYPQAEKARQSGGVALGDLFDTTRGLVTGDNSFFIMDREQIEARGLPFECFRPVLPGSRFIPGDEIEADADGLPLIQKQLFLLDTRLAEDEIHQRYPALRTYLESGHGGEKPVSARYICRSRKPWYAQEKRPAAPIICTYMGRSRAGASPFRFILNHSQATACNTYLLLYPKPALARAAQKNPAVLRTAWQFLCGIEPEQLMAHGRVYGGGLHKLEPKELRGFPADDLSSRLPAVAMPQPQIDLLGDMA